MTMYVVQSQDSIKRLNKALEDNRVRLMTDKKKALEYLRSIDPDLDKRLAKASASKSSKK